MKIYYLSAKLLKITGLIMGLLLLIITGSVALGGYSKLYSGSPRSNLIILAYNELGMHCIQPDYSSFLILPPGNNLRVQVFQKGEAPRLIMQGITVKYRMNSLYQPSRFSNFWQYAANYGYPVNTDVGVTGNSLVGQLQPDPSSRFWQVTAIPVIGRASNPEVAGSGLPGPYQTATISVYDSATQKLLGEVQNVVIPVSDEMNCGRCHGTQDTWSNILKAHDKLESTSLYAQSLEGTVYRCSKCHADPILEAPGLLEVPSLSLAMHNFHQDKQAACIDCHPGSITHCNRGVMAGKGFKCEDCHGNLTVMAQNLKKGRTPWLQEPTCRQCHKAIYAENPATLYRNSYLTQSPHKDMNNLILCASCHNSPHAEWPSTLQVDNLLPIGYQGTAQPIGANCDVCHLKMQGKVH